MVPKGKTGVGGGGVGWLAWLGAWERVGREWAKSDRRTLVRPTADLVTNLHVVDDAWRLRVQDAAEPKRSNDFYPVEGQPTAWSQAPTWPRWLGEGEARVGFSDSPIGAREEYAVGAAASSGVRCMPVPSMLAVGRRTPSSVQAGARATTGGARIGVVSRTAL